MTTTYFILLCAINVSSPREPLLFKLIQKLPWGGTELHVEVSLSKILNPRIAPDVQLAPCVATAISKGPAMSWRLIQGVPWPSLMCKTGFGPSKPRNPSRG